MTHDVLANIWFVILGVLLGGYAVLDGFDLGVGIVHLFVTRNETERRIAINSIGPIWDGNEVWLVTFGGAMFAMFPFAYASIFSALYTALMLLLFMLIFRAVSIELRGKMHSKFGKNAWDAAFAVGSAGAALLFGVAAGNALRGIPVDVQTTFTGTIFDQLNPYCLLTGLLSVSLCALHGAIYLHLKATGDLCERLRRCVWTTWIIFVLLFVITTIWSLIAVPRTGAPFQRHPWMWIVPVLNALSVANIGRCMKNHNPRGAFISSGATVLSMVFLLTAAMFPNLVTATDPANDLSIYNAASSTKTLTIGLIIVAIGMPFVLTYTFIIYWTFRGKVELTEHSY